MPSKTSKKKSKKKSLKKVSKKPSLKKVSKKPSLKKVSKKPSLKKVSRNNLSVKKLSKKKKVNKISKNNISKAKTYLIQKGGSISDELSVLLPKLVNKMLDVAEKGIVRGEIAIKIKFFLQPYILYFNDKLNIDKYNMLIVFYHMIKDPLNVVYNEIPGLKRLKLSQLHEIREALKDGRGDEYPLYKKMYEEEKAKLDKLILFYPFLQYLYQSVDHNDYSTFDEKRFLFSDCISINYINLFEKKRIVVKYHNISDLDSNNLLFHPVYSPSDIQATGVNRDFPKIKQFSKFDSFEKINIVSILDDLIIIKIDNETLEPITGSQNSWFDLINAVDENSDLQKEIMSGEYNIFNY